MFPAGSVRSPSTPNEHHSYGRSVDGPETSDVDGEVRGTAGDVRQAVVVTEEDQRGQWDNTFLIGGKSVHQSQIPGGDPCHDDIPSIRRRAAQLPDVAPGEEMVFHVSTVDEDGNLVTTKWGKRGTRKKSAQWKGRTGLKGYK